MSACCSQGTVPRDPGPNETDDGTSTSSAACAADVDTQALPTLKDAFDEHFRVGVAVSSPTFMETDAAAAELVQTQFNRLSPENVLKWSQLHPTDGTFVFGSADRYVDFGESAGMQIHGHVLVWHQQAPSWVFQDDTGQPISREALMARLEEHIGEVGGRYGGRIAYWDVVNEAFEDDGSLRDTPWRQILGDDYLAEVLAMADPLLPDSRLVYNDYSLFLTAKRDAVVAMVTDLQSRGIRIDAVGMQGHYNMGRPRTDELEAAIAAFSGAGVEVLITELDLDVLPSERAVQGADLDATQSGSSALNPYTECLPADVEQTVAARWSELFGTLIAHSADITSVTFWGVSDGHSWLNDWPVNGRTNYPLLFDRRLQPKSSFVSVIEQVSP